MTFIDAAFSRVVATFATVTAHSPFRMPRSATLIPVALTLLLIVGSPIATSAQHSLDLPEPGGKFAVGVRYLHLVDEDRPDPFLDGEAQPRELMVKLYYPAVPDPAQPPARYFHGSTDLTRAFAEFYQLPAGTFDHLSLAESHARENLAVSPDEPSYSVVLFSHGAGTSMEVQTAQSEDLASHGYIVAAIDHPFVSAATNFPDRLVRATDATTVFDVPEPAAVITRHMADDVRFVIRELGRLNQGAIAPGFEGRLNLDAIGVIGHSVGGAVAYDLAINDPSVMAAVNLDGAVYVAPGAPDAIAPFLMVASDNMLVPALQQRLSLMEAFPGSAANGPEGPDSAAMVDPGDPAVREARQHMVSLADVLQASGDLYTVTGCDHMLFTDIGLYFDRETRALLGIGGDTEPARCLESTSALTVAFFDLHLKGLPESEIDKVVQDHPEVKQITLGEP